MVLLRCQLDWVTLVQHLQMASSDSQDENLGHQYCLQSSIYHLQPIIFLSSLPARSTFHSNSTGSPAPFQTPGLSTF